MSAPPSELKRLRKDAGLLQVQMSERMGMSLRRYQIAEKHGARPIHILAARWVHHEAMATK